MALLPVDSYFSSAPEPVWRKQSHSQQVMWAVMSIDNTAWQQECLAEQVSLPANTQERKEWGFLMRWSLTNASRKLMERWCWTCCVEWVWRSMWTGLIQPEWQLYIRYIKKAGAELCQAQHNLDWALRAWAAGLLTLISGHNLACNWVATWVRMKSVTAVNSNSLLY